MAEFIKIYKENPNPKEIQKIVKVLQNGGLIIYPTDTVYGLGCDFTNTKALEKIAKIKGIKLEKSNFSFICKSSSTFIIFLDFFVLFGLIIVPNISQREYRFFFFSFIRVL